MRQTGQSRLTQKTSESRNDEKRRLQQAQNELEQEKQNAKDIQNQLLEEIENLKGNQQHLSRPGTASAELAEIQRERDQLKIENKNMMKQIQDLNNQIKKLMEQDQAAAAQPAPGGGGPNDQQVRQLTAKVK